MNALLIATWLALPLAPLNPIEEDTLSSLSAHITAGVVAHNGIVATGPGVSTKLEMLFVHPLMVRTSVDIRYGQINTKIVPQGEVYVVTFAIESLYYRGTDRMTGYFGAGPVMALHHYSPYARTSDSLTAINGRTELTVVPQFGYRLTVGMRFRRSYSLEVNITEVSPLMRKTSYVDSGSYVLQHQRIRTGGFQVALGYLFDL